MVVDEVAQQAKIDVAGRVPVLPQALELPEPLPGERLGDPVVPGRVPLAFLLHPPSGRRRRPRTAGSRRRIGRPSCRATSSSSLSCPLGSGDWPTSHRTRSARLAGSFESLAVTPACYWDSPVAEETKNPHR